MLQDRMKVRGLPADLSSSSSSSDVIAGGKFKSSEYNFKKGKTFKGLAQIEKRNFKGSYFGFGPLRKLFTTV